MMITKDRIKSFQKPEVICRELNTEEKQLISLPPDEFADIYLNKICKSINDVGLNLRHAIPEDIIALKGFIDNHYREDLIDEVSPYDMYRFIEFGYSVLIENNDRKILGCLFEIGYDTNEKPSYSIRLGIHDSVHGKDLGRLITLYTCFLAMRRGSKIKKGLIDFDNLVQIYIQVNKIGWIFDEFFPDLKGMGSCYECILPLTPEALLLNRIDNKKTMDFIKNSKQGVDYIIKDVNDLKGIAELYAENDFKVVAFLRSDIFGYDNHHLLLLPSKTLNLNIMHTNE